MSNQVLSPVTHYTYDDKNAKAYITTGVNSARPRQVYTQYNASHQSVQSVMVSVPVDNPGVASGFNPFPVSEENLATQYVYDGRHLKVVVTESNGHHTFFVRDSAGAIIYQVSNNGHVVEYSRNGFGEVAQKTQYFNSLALDLTAYATTGIPRAVVQAAIHPQPGKDRVTRIEHDLEGRRTHLKKGPVFWFVHGSSDSLKTQAWTDTAQSYNAFCEVTARSVLCNPQTGAKRLTLNYYDHHGSVVLKASSVNAYDGSPSFAIIQKQFNAFGECVSEDELATPLNMALTPQTPLATIISKLTAAPNDRKTQYTFSKRGEQLTQTKLGVVRQQVNWAGPSKGPQLQDLSPRNLTTTSAYGPVSHMRVSVTNHYGHTQYSFYNALLKLVAASGSPFIPQYTGEKNPAPVAPLTWYYNNAFSERLGQTDFAYGTVPPSNADTLPQPIGTNSIKDRFVLFWLDNRGLKMASMNAAGVTTGYTLTTVKKVKRSFMPASTWNFTGKPTDALLPKTQHIDSTVFSFDDKMDVPTLMQTLRDGKVITQRYSRYNPFFEVDGQGPNPNVILSMTATDPAGRVYLHPKQNGSAEITVKDLSGATTGSFGSATHNLNTLSYSALPTLLNMSAEDLERTVRVYDAGNRIEHVLYPEFPETQMMESLKQIPIAVSVTGTRLSWPLVKEKNATQTLKIYPVGAPEKVIKNITPSVRAGFCEVDLSEYDLPTDRYAFEIDYVLKANLEGGLSLSELINVSSGEIQLSTAKTEGSRNPVFIAKRNSGTLTLQGNVDGAQKIKLYYEAKLLGELPVTHVSDTEYTADLSSFPTGVYTAELETASGTSAMSLPFNILTNAKATAPTMAEFTCDLDLKTAEQYVQVNFTAVAPFADKDLQITLSYRDTAGKTQQETHSFNPTEFKHVTIDSTDFAYSFKVSQSVDVILSLDLSMAWQAGALWLPIVQGLGPVISGKAAVASKSKEIKAASIKHFPFLSQRVAMVDLVFLLDAQMPATGQVQNTSEGLYAQSVQVPLLKATRNDSSMVLPSHSSFSINLTGFPTGSYPFSFELATPEKLMVGMSHRAFTQAPQAPTTVEMVLWLNDGSPLYLSEDFPTLSVSHKQSHQFKGTLAGKDEGWQPVRRIKRSQLKPNSESTPKATYTPSGSVDRSYDVWNNTVVFSDLIDAIYHYGYNDDNQLRWTQLPPLNICDNLGNFKSGVQPIEYKGYGYEDELIGESNGRYGVTATIYDQALRPFQTVTPDGIIQIHKRINAIGHMEGYYDDWGASYGLTINGAGQVLGFNPPEGLGTTWFYYNEQGMSDAFMLESNYFEGGLVKLYTFTNYDREARVSATQTPLGVITLYSHGMDLNTGHYTFEKFMAGDEDQYMVSDWYGNRLLIRGVTGSITQFDYDFKKQVVHQRRTGGNLGTSVRGVLNYTSTVFGNVMDVFVIKTPVADQSLTFTWQGGLLTQVNDAGTAQFTQYQYNSARLRTYAMTRSYAPGQNQVLAVEQARYDVLQRPYWSWDAPSLFVSAYDRSSNLTFRTGQLFGDSGWQSPLSTHTSFNQYTVGNLIVNNDGLRGGGINLSQGVAFDYDIGDGQLRLERIHETKTMVNRVNGNAVQVRATLSYTPDNLYARSDITFLAGKTMSAWLTRDQGTRWTVKFTQTGSIADTSDNISSTYILSKDGTVVGTKGDSSLHVKGSDNKSHQQITNSNSNYINNYPDGRLMVQQVETTTTIKNVSAVITVGSEAFTPTASHPHPRIEVLEDDEVDDSMSLANALTKSPATPGSTLHPVFQNYASVFELFKDLHLVLRLRTGAEPTPAQSMPDSSSALTVIPKRPLKKDQTTKMTDTTYVTYVEASGQWQSFQVTVNREDGKGDKTQGNAFETYDSNGHPLSQLNEDVLGEQHGTNFFYTTSWDGRIISQLSSTQRQVNSIFGPKVVGQLSEGRFFYDVNGGYLGSHEGYNPNNAAIVPYGHKIQPQVETDFQRWHGGFLSWFKDHFFNGHPQFKSGSFHMAQQVKAMGLPQGRQFERAVAAKWPTGKPGSGSWWEQYGASCWYGGSRHGVAKLSRWIY